MSSFVLYYKCIFMCRGHAQICCCFYIVGMCLCVHASVKRGTSKNAVGERGTMKERTYHNDSVYKLSLILVFN